MLCTFSETAKTKSDLLLSFCFVGGGYRHCWSQSSLDHIELTLTYRIIFVYLYSTTDIVSFV